jgi:hypothetical protein
MNQMYKKTQSKQLSLFSQVKEDKNIPSKRVQEKPIYDERVKEILRGLAEGKTRDQLADEFDQKNYRSLDMYMRRRNFKWDSRDQTYDPSVVKDKPNFPITDSSKAGQVLTLLAKEGADLKSIAQRIGFRDHLELAQYMAARGYEWDTEQGTYVKVFGKIQEEEEENKRFWTRLLNIFKSRNPQRLIQYQWGH